MVFNATFNNISVMSLRIGLLVEETGVPIGNASHWQTLSHNIVLSIPRLCGIRTHYVSADWFLNAEINRIVDRIHNIPTHGDHVSFKSPRLYLHLFSWSPTSLVLNCQILENISRRETFDNVRIFIRLFDWSVIFQFEIHIMEDGPCHRRCDRVELDADLPTSKKSIPIIITDGEVEVFCE